MDSKASSTYLRRNVTETMKIYGLSALLAFGILLVIPAFVNYTLLYYVGGIMFLMSVLAPTVARWRPKEKIAPHGKAVFITGCDSGFGYMMAQKLDNLGFHVFAGCLFPDGVGASSLRQSGSNRLHVIGLNVTSDHSIQKAAAYVEENLKSKVLWAVVNNAGINEPGEMHWASMESIQRVFDVNTMGVVRVTKAFLAKLKESKGRIITIASLGGRYTIPGIVQYCMSKIAVIGFCDGLRQEMYKWGIQVVTIEPSFYRTPMTSEEEVTRSFSQSWENAPKDSKDMYSSNYFEKGLKGINDAVKIVVSHPREVVSVMEDAITAVYPEYSYSPGSLITKIPLWILLRLPKPIGDMLIYRVFSYAGFQ